MAHAVPRPQIAPSAAALLTPDALELDRRCRQLWRAILGDGSLRAAATADGSPIRHVVWRLGRSDGRCDPVEGAARLIVELAARGAAEAHLRPVVLLLDEVLAACYAGGAAVRTLAEIDRAEIVADYREDVAEQERHLAAVVGALTPDLLDAQAEADEGEAALLIERSRTARREARRIRHERRTAPAWAGRRSGLAAAVRS